MIFVYERYLKTTKLGYWFIALNMQNVTSLKCKQKLHGFPENKNSNRRKVLIRKLQYTDC